MRSERPAVSPPTLSGLDIALEILAIAGLIIMIGLIADLWPALPASVPSHFDITGQPDEWGSKNTLLIFPIAGLILYALTSLAVRFPRMINYPVRITPQNAQRQYTLVVGMMRWLKAEVIWMMAFLAWQTAQVALGRAGALAGEFVFIIVGAMLITFVVYFIQALRAR